MGGSDAKTAPAAEAAGASSFLLLSEQRGGLARGALGVLLEELERRSRELPDPSVSTGTAGAAVCWAFLSRSLSDARAADRARDALDAAIDVLADQALSTSFYAGFPGIAWAAEVVDALLGGDTEDRSEAIDDALVTVLRQYPADAPYDLIHGLVGLGVYGLARLPRPGAVEIVTMVVRQLERRAQHDAEGAYWWTPPSRLLGARQQQYPQGGVDLGVAHGIAGVIPFLARVDHLRVGPSVRPLLDDSVSWLLSHTVATSSGPTVPYFIAEGEEPSRARTAWCYGDPGVACALLLAARHANEPEWGTVARSLALQAARLPLADTGVSDAGLCHGSAGLMHLYRRMYELTGDADLGAAALRWLDSTLDLCSRRAARAELRPPESSPLWNAPWNGLGVLEGLSGVVLALASTCTDVEPVWDQMLLVSTPGPAGISRT